MTVILALALLIGGWQPSPPPIAHRVRFHTVCTMPATWWAWGPRPHATCRREQIRP